MRERACALSVLSHLLEAIFKDSDSDTGTELMEESLELLNEKGKFCWRFHQAFISS
jgi:hypothetical protein